jgi:hypothetical protein
VTRGRQTRWSSCVRAPCEARFAQALLDQSGDTVVRGDWQNHRRKRMRATSRTGLRFWLLLTLLLAATSAHAIDAKKAALNLAKAAAGAYEGGDMIKAARLYMEAFRTDAAEPNYLYSAARAEQAAGQSEHADQHYRQFIATPGADKERVSRAKGYLDELAGLRADEKLEAAERFSRRNEWALAAAAYAEAARLRPDRVVLLYRAAVAANEGGDRSHAAEWLGAYLTRAPAHAADRGEAQLLLESLTRLSKPEKTEAAKPVPAAPEVAKPEPQEPPKVIAVAEPKPIEPAQPQKLIEPAQPQKPMETVTQRPETPQPSMQRTAAWITLGTGGAVTLAGVILLAVGKSQESSFYQALNVQNGKVTGTLTDHDAAVAQASAISGRETAGGVMMGVGLVAAGAGVYLLLTAPTQNVAVMPDGRGMRLGWRF